MHASIGQRAATRRLLTRFRSLVLAVPLAVGVLAPATPVYAASTITVTTTADELTNNGNCSLREAIRATNLDRVVDACPAGRGDDTIIVPAGTYALAIAGAGEDASLTGDLDITASLTLEGAGASSTIVDGRGLDGVLQVLGPSSVVRISMLTIANGSTFGIVDRTGGGLANGSLLTSPDITPGGNVSVVESVFRDNSGRSGGGGIENNSGAMTLINTTINGNATAFLGGGVLNGDRMTIINSTISDNRAASGIGGGIANGAAARLTIIGSTISGNSANLGGGGISNTGALTIQGSTVAANTGGGLGGAASVGNTIIANNSGLPGEETTPADCVGTIISQGYNLIQDATGCTLGGVTTGNLLGVDGRLGPLQDNGGPTQTHLPLSASPAIDAGNPAAPGSTAEACPTTDQRGVSRPQDGNSDGRAVCDIGAVEVQAPVTFASLCALSRQLVSNRAMATGMCTVLDAAQRNERLGVPRGKARELDAYRRLVAASLRAHFLFVDQAATLTELSRQL
jgi:CSLREA domain-containing protein